MINLIKSFVSDERGVLTPGAFIFFLAAFGVFGSVLSLSYLTIQKENLLAAAEPAAMATIRAIHEGRRGAPIDSIEDAKKFAKAAVVAFSDGTGLDKLMGPADIPAVSEFAESVIDVKLFPLIETDFYDVIADSEPGAPVLEDEGTPVAEPTFAEATNLSEVALVVIEVHFTEARKSSLSAGFYNFLSPRHNLRTQTLAMAYVPSCMKTGVYSASEIYVRNNLDAVGPSCIRTDRMWYELMGGKPGDHSFNIRVDGAISIRNKLAEGYYATVDPDNLDSDDVNQVEISAPYMDGLDPKIPAKRVQYRTWRAKELYDFDTVYKGFATRNDPKFRPNYLNYDSEGNLKEVIRFRATDAVSDAAEPGVNTVKPADFSTNNVNIVSNCGDENDEIRLQPGHYDHFVMLTECRLIVSDEATFENVTIMTKAEPKYVEQDTLFTDIFGNLSKVVWYPSIRFQASDVGNYENSCNAKSGLKQKGIVFWAGRGNIQFENTLSAYNTQFIMGSLPRKSGTGEEIDMNTAIAGALDAKNNGEIVNSFRDIVKLRGSSITSIYPTHFYDTLYMEGCLNENVTNRYFRPYFKPLNLLKPTGGVAY